MLGAMLTRPCNHSMLNETSGGLVSMLTHRLREPTGSNSCYLQKGSCDRRKGATASLAPLVPLGADMGPTSPRAARKQNWDFSFYKKSPSPGEKMPN
jgi:hypothetical protein